jgi:hypothetical protein
VFYHATIAAMEEAGDAFDTAYAASMRARARIHGPSFLKRNATD